MSTTVKSQQYNEPKIQIKIQGGLGIGMNIKNIGDEDVYNITCNLSIKGGIFDRINISIGWGISHLPKDDRLNFGIGIGPITGFGRVTINASADIENGEKETEEVNGFVIFIWTVILPD